MINSSVIHNFDGIKITSKRKFHHHHKWEDYKNGLYSKRKEDSFVQASRDILIDAYTFKSGIYKMFSNWEYCIEHQLTNPYQNRKAYIGQATCNFICGSSMYETILAWNELNLGQKKVANKVAKESIIDWLISQKPEVIQLKLWKNAI